MTHTTRRRTSALVLVLVGTALAGTLTGCSWIDQQTGDAWGITYEVSVDGPVGTPLRDVRVEGAEQRGDAPSVEHLGTRKTGRATGSGSTWRHEMIVLTEDRARVRATPPAGKTATCRISIDGTREIAQAVGAPGQAVVCSTTTPTFATSR